MTHGFRLVVEHLVPADRSRVWAAVSEPDRISVWFTACQAIGGGVYRLRFEEEDGPWVKHAHVLKCDPSGFEYRFRLEDPGSPDSEVEVRLEEPATGATRVVLWHDDPPADLVAGYRDGWRDFLTELEESLR